MAYKKRALKNKSEIMGKLAIYLKFIEIFPEYKRFCVFKKYKLGNVQNFLFNVDKFPESILHMKNCIICRSASSPSKQLPLCWNCMISIECIEYNSLNETFIEHNEFNFGDNNCFNDFGELDRKKCIHKK